MKSLKKNEWAQDLLYVGLILIFSVLISSDLFKGQFIRSFDYAGTLMRLLAMQQCLGHGQWVVRWVPQMYFGYGYPLFNFYPPLFYMLGDLITHLGEDIVHAINLALFIFIALSGCTMYLFARELMDKEGAFVSATAYLFAPYHITDLYLRGAAAETASFVFFPLILWSFYKLQQTSSKRHIVFSALSCAGLLLTHNCMSMIFFPAVFLYILLLYWPYSSVSRCLSLLRGFGALALGIGLAAFFWLPALMEKKFVHMELLTQGDLNFKENFVQLKNLFTYPWGINFIHIRDPRLCCQIGIVHVLTALITVFALNKIVVQSPRLKKHILFFIFIFIGAVFLVLPNSMLIWEHIPALQLLQFPFRFMTIVVLSASVLAGAAVLAVPPKYRLKAALVVVLSIILTNIFHCHPYGTFICDLRQEKADPNKYLSKLSLQDGGEYIPIWVKRGVKGLPVGRPSWRFQAFTLGDQVLYAKEISPLSFKFKVQAHNASIFLFHNFYFPGWIVKVDGRKINILKDTTYGLIFFNCPQGVHNVEIYFGTTPIRQIAQAISIASLILLVMMGAISRRSLLPNRRINK